MIGLTAGRKNVGFGHECGENVVNGYNNTFIGSQSGFDKIDGNYDDSTALGWMARITASNQIMLGTANETVEIPGNLNIAANKVATAPTVAGTGDNTNNIATTAFVQAVIATVDAGSMATNIASKANKDNAILTGTPTAPTAASTIDTDQIATTKFVQERITTIIGGAPAALDTLKEITDALTGADSTAGAITTTIADNATAITTEAAAARAAETTLQTNIDNLNSSVSGGSTFINATTFAHYTNPVHIGGSTAPVDTSLQVTGNIKTTGDVIFTGNLKQDNGAGILTDFQGGAFSIEAGGFAHYPDNIHIGGSTAPAVGSKLEVTGNIKTTGDVIFTGSLKQDDGVGNVTDFQGGAFSIEEGGFAHYSDNIHIGGSTAPADGSKLEVAGDIKMSGVIRQW